MKKKLPGEGKRWKWKALNATWQGAAAKRMPGFHVRKKKKMGGKGKGKRKGFKSQTTAVAVPQPPTAPVAQPVVPVAAQPQVATGAPATPGTAVWSSGEPVIAAQPTSNPQVVNGYVFNPQTQTWVSAATSAPKGWASETLAPKSMPNVQTTTFSPAIWAPAAVNGALRGAPASYPPVVSSTLSPMPAQFATALPAQYQALSTTTPVFWR